MAAELLYPIRVSGAKASANLNKIRQRSLNFLFRCVGPRRFFQSCGVLRHSFKPVSADRSFKLMRVAAQFAAISR